MVQCSSSAALRCQVVLKAMALSVKPNCWHIDLVAARTSIGFLIAACGPIIPRRQALLFAFYATTLSGKTFSGKGCWLERVVAATAAAAALL